MDREAAVLIARVVSDGIASFDEMYRSYSDFLDQGVAGTNFIPPPDFQYADSPQDGGFVARSRHTGGVYESVTYEQLCERLQHIDRESIESMSRAMASRQMQWNKLTQEIAVASGPKKEKLEEQLTILSNEISEGLIMILDVVRGAGLSLDDHYLMARRIAQKHLGRQIDV